MGWSHALWFCQTLFCDLAKRTAPEVPVLEDYAPSPPLDRCAISVYVDNFAVLGLDEAQVRDVGQRVLAAVHESPNTPNVLSRLLLLFVRLFVYR